MSRFVEEFIYEHKCGILIFMILVLFMTSITIPDIIHSEGSIVWLEQKEYLRKSGIMTVNLSNVNRGIIGVKICPKNHTGQYKIFVQKGEKYIHYTINNEGDYEIYPLEYGNGEYDLTLYRQLSGNHYQCDESISFKVSMDDEASYLLSPNQMINYNDEMRAIQCAKELCEGKDDAEKIKAIKDYIKQNYCYDYFSAIHKGEFQPADIEEIFEKKKGTCLGLSTIVVAMLRSQGIKVKLAIGKADSLLHAWVVIYKDDKRELYDPTTVLRGVYTKVHYEYERGY